MNERDFHTIVAQKEQIIEALQQENRELAAGIRTAEAAILKMLSLSEKLEQKAADGADDLELFKSSLFDFANKTCEELDKLVPQEELTEEAVESIISGLSLEDKRELVLFLRNLKNRK